MPQAIDVTSLRLLRAIADQGTITGAAATLGYTQPAVSQHVRRLERRLGMPVLERHARGVRLTEAGAVLARHGAYVAAAVDAAEREVTALGALTSGRVRLSSFPSASATVVPPALAGLREHAPGLEVSFSEAEPPDSLDRLREGECDVVIAFEYTEASAATSRRTSGARWAGEQQDGLHRRYLLTDTSVLVMGENDPRSQKRRLHLRDLADTPWITGCPSCRDNVVSACEAAGFSPEIIFGTDDYVATLAFVAAGLGVTLLPGLTSATAARQPGVMVRTVGGVAPRTVFAATTADLARLPAVEAVLDALQESASIL